MARSVRALVAVGLSTVLVTSMALPADAKPKYPSKSEVDKAEQEADESAGAAAAMQRKLAGEQAKLATLDREVEIAVEAYNGAVYKLGEAKKSYTSAKKRAAQSEAGVEKSRKGVAAIASNAYAGNGVGQYVSLFGSDDPQSVVDGAGSLHALGEQQSGTLQRYQAAKIVRDVVKRQTAKALARQRAETKRVAAAKKVAESKLVAQQTVLNNVAAISTKLAKQAATDEHTASNVAHERKAGIAEARRIAAAKAAAEARKRARAAAAAAAAAAQDKPDKPRGGNGGGGNGGGNGGGVGPSVGGGGNTVAVRFARAQLGEWYLWAADGPNRWDCSGLTMVAWRKAGKSLPHWSVGQYYQTRRVSLSNLRKGDLVFYADNTNNPDSIHHVGMYIGGGRMIEAPHSGAQVRVASIYRSGLIGAGRP